MTAPVAALRPTDQFLHEAFLYRDESDFLSGVLAFVREGLERDETVIVVEPPVQIDLLRDALGDDAGAVSFHDMVEIGRNPARIIPLWSEAVAEHAAGGRGLRGVGEPTFVGRRSQELVECLLHETLLNSTFQPGPPWQLLCPYDERLLPATVRDGALLTHPLWSTPTDRGSSDTFAAPVHTADGGIDAADPGGFGSRLPLPPPTDAVIRGEFGPDDVAAVRHTVGQYARFCGLPDRQVEDLQVAAEELATNSIRHGGGRGSIAMWREPDAAVVEFTDRGQMTDPLGGRRPPGPGAPATGLYLVNRLCDLVQVRSSAAGTTVRLNTWL
ncbi:sensor histidine kinase [Geodermatophilus sp. YIM 151500]|uniref:sensor histidine kinase n=1 Tax=Geodermatophilus sp. YIM 151500 TaxID=2984531 RepID=UPI0021E3B0F6|nr:sensor histidine kinase [Geodermatophilus sp. YIM 151500]MCV2487844.1 sensor histidine kinase [Geodermatophilus sp. YIM 151500]